MLCTFDVFSTKQLVNDIVSASSDSSDTHTAAQSASRSQGENSWASVRVETKTDETYILFHFQTGKWAWNRSAQLSNNNILSRKQEEP